MDDGVRTRLRPTGLSGWVKTALISDPESKTACKEGIAHSGVPMKIMLILLHSRKDKLYLADNTIV